jgi:molybdenum cofactor cytidylyltransferase
VSEITGVLLAAGAATRFGSDKLMHPLPDGTPIALASALVLRAALPQMLVVVRPDSSALAQLLMQHGIRTVVAANTADGMGASLAQGIAACAEAQGWLVALADMPFIKPSTMVAIADALRDGAAISAPVYQGQRGHPVGFTTRFAAQLMALSGDEGARAIVREHAAEVRQIECDDPGVLADIDRPADLIRDEI